MSMIKKDLSKAYNNYLAPEALIWIDGKKLSAEGIYFSNLEIEKTFDATDTFSFSISDVITMEFEEKHTDLFALGNKVEIHIGYADSHEEKSKLNMLFIGLITNVNWNFSEENYLDISIEGHDYSFLMMKHHYENIVQEQSISGILESLLDEVYGEIFSKDKRDIEPTEVIYPQSKNQEENDYLFIDILAKKVGYEFYVDNEKLIFKSAPKNQDSSLVLYYGQEILSFKPELNIQKEVSKVKVVGLEFSENNKPIVAEASVKREEDSFNGSGIKVFLRKLNEVKYEVREPVTTVAEAQIRANALLENFSSNYFKAEIKSIGIPELKAGITISLEGLGKRFSRDYYVEKASHSFSEQGYETTLTVRGSSSSSSSFSILAEES